MTVLGIVSDTHLPRFGRALPRALVDGLRDEQVERILHCGDMTDLLAVDCLRPSRRSTRSPEITTARKSARASAVKNSDRRRRAHWDGARRHGAHAAPRNAAAAFGEDDVEVICFGHSHRALNERQGRRLLLNPGSPTDKRMNARYSFATLRVDAGRVVRAQVHFYFDRSVAS